MHSFFQLKSKFVQKKIIFLSVNGIRKKCNYIKHTLCSFFKMKSFSKKRLREWSIDRCCVFQPASGCFTHCSQVRIVFFVFKHLLLSQTGKKNKMCKKRRKNTTCRMRKQVIFNNYLLMTKMQLKIISYRIYSHISRPEYKPTPPKFRWKKCPK